MSERPVFTGWRKSRRSGGADNCVEVAVAGNGVIGVRDSKDPDGGVIAVSPREWTTFLAALRAPR